MRLWSLHPKHLDRQGLLALWREGLLAQAVLQGKTKGYVNHPQLQRFKQHTQPLRALAHYLCIVHEEATKRGYAFNKKKIVSSPTTMCIELTTGQFLHEQQHLQKKLVIRDTKQHRTNAQGTWEHHPLFIIAPGEKADWEKS